MNHPLFSSGLERDVGMELGLLTEPTWLSDPQAAPMGALEPAAWKLIPRAGLCSQAAAAPL